MKAIRVILVGLGLITAVGVVGWFYIPINESETTDLEETLTLPLLDTTKILEPKMYYGYVVDSLEIIHKKIKRNEFLANILSRHNISNDDIHLLTQRVKGVYNIRKIGVRKPYELICYKDDKQTAKAMIYHPNAVDYVVFNLEDSIYAKAGSH